MTAWLCLAGSFCAFPGVASTLPDPDLKALQLACSEASGVAPTLEGFRVDGFPGAPGDLPYLLVTNGRSGATVRIYFDADLEGQARAKAACFGGLLALTQPAVPDPREAIVWAPIVLTRVENYVPPQRGVEHRWVVPNFPGRWEGSAIDFLVVTMPHEETHMSQSALRKLKLPRWFQEGHAEWTGLRVAQQVRPDLAAVRRNHLVEARDALAKPELGAWGGMRIKPEAFERQLSAADRERRARDPSFVPAGPFRFTPDDFAEDNSNTEGRYGASLAIFELLERRHGVVAVQGWITAVLQDADEKPGRIIQLAQEMLGEDLAPLLK